MHQDIEVALFRAVQEGLTNAHRHSGCSVVEICLSLHAKELRLEIKDDGRGIAKKQLKSLIEEPAEAGVGLAGMRERVRELGGSLELRSGRGGTTVVIRIPAEKASIDSEQAGESGGGISAA